MISHKDRIIITRLMVLIISSLTLLVYINFNQKEKNKKIFVVDDNILTNNVCPVPTSRFWQVQSIDTMKYSRDHADIHMKDKHFMNVIINKQVVDIAATGATHVAINTSYDEQFLPMLEKWVETARQNNLKVFFRGNWSDWEGWFKYPKNLDRKKHIEKTRQFIIEHPGLFEDGDIFSTCPECENGGPGDPRKTGDIAGHRNFLIEEYKTASKAFKLINKSVDVSNFSMNGDVAELIMNKETTRALGGVMTIDHYVKTGEILANDVKRYAEKSGGKIFIAEFGAPAGHIHGNMSEKQQAQWVEEVFKLLSQDKNIVGINYWVNMKGSTAIWNTDGTPRKAVDVLSRYYKPNILYGRISDELDMPIKEAKVTVGCQAVITDKNGCFSMKYILTDKSCSKDTDVNIFKKGFKDVKIENNTSELIKQSMELEEETLKFKIQKFTRELKKSY